MEFIVRTNEKQEVIDITHQVQDIIKDVKEGLCHVFAKHTTCSIIINENDDPNICGDILLAYNRAMPDQAGYKHDSLDGNAGAHVKAAMLGSSETIPIKDGKLDLGRWQALMLVEFDGPRERGVKVSVLSSSNT